VTKEEIHYGTNLKAHLQNLLGQGMRKFEDLVAMSGGAYPTVVKEMVEKLISEGVIESSIRFSETPADPTIEKSDDKETSGSCVDPHPLDYDWRFSKTGREAIVNELDQYLIPRAKIALFGTQTLAAALEQKKVNVTLYNNSRVLVDELKLKQKDLQIVLHDLFNPISNSLGYFDFVIADPPWYEEDNKAFVLRGAQVLKIDGLLFLSMFPWLTRPRAVAERESILKFAIDAGFDTFKIIPASLKYETPKFERISLKQDGINLANDWRVGDLYILRKVRDSSIDLNTVFIHDESVWEDYVLNGNKRVKLKIRADRDDELFSFKHIDSGRILKTVSRRSPLRNGIDLWTSHNEAYSVNGIGVVKDALTLIQNGIPVNTVVSKLRKKHAGGDSEWNKLNEFLMEITTDTDISN
jgi:hypothetical protein